MCNGDNSTCSCVVYEDFTVPEMDCRLVRFSLSNIVEQIDELISTLTDIRDATSTSTPARRAAEERGTESDTILRYIGEEVLDSNDFVRSCVNYYASALNTFINDDVAPAAGIRV